MLPTVQADPLPGLRGRFRVGLEPCRHDPLGDGSGFLARGAGIEIAQPFECMDNAFERRRQPCRAAEIDLRDRCLDAVNEEMPGPQRDARGAVARQWVGRRRQQPRADLLAHRHRQHRSGNAHAIGEANQPLGRIDRQRGKIGNGQRTPRLDHLVTDSAVAAVCICLVATDDQLAPRPRSTSPWEPRNCLPPQARASPGRERSPRPPRYPMSLSAAILAA